MNDGVECGKRGVLFQSQRLHGGVVQNAWPAETPSEPVEVEEVRVTGEATGSLTSSSPEESAKQKQQVPGGFTIKGAEEMKLGRASNFEDLLQRAPGVFAQSENGGEISKISIRGSGITAEDEPLGVMFLLDGSELHLRRW